MATSKNMASGNQKTDKDRDPRSRTRLGVKERTRRIKTRDYKYLQTDKYMDRVTEAWTWSMTKCVNGIKQCLQGLLRTLPYNDKDNKKSGKMTQVQARTMTINRAQYIIRLPVPTTYYCVSFGE